MRLKRSNVGVCVCALVSFVVLSVTALTAAPALALPEGRVYEMVSPVYKGGYAVAALEAVAPDGNSVAFFSLGAFAGAPGGPKTIDYVARRGTAGWATAPVMPPATMMPYVAITDVSSTLESVLTLGKPGPSIEAAFGTGTENEFLLHGLGTPDTAENWLLAGGMVLKAYGGEQVFTATYEGASADFCHLLLGESEAPLLSEAIGTSQALYELDRGCGGGEPSLRLVGVKNKLGPHNEPAVLAPHCRVWAGSTNKDDYFNAVAAGGREIFFTTEVNPSSYSCGDIGADPTNPKQLFVRVDGARTLEVSRPLDTTKEFGGCVAGGVPGEVPCDGAATRAPAFFQGASEDGSKVFFTTTVPLVTGDTDNKNDLYMATIGCPSGEPECEVAKREVTSLVQVSHDPNGEAAEVPQGVFMQGVVRVAPDGSRVYFVARGVLSKGLNAEEHAPVKGADNLYVYDTTTGTTTFVVDLCSGPEHSGTFEDPRCPEGLDSGERGRNDMELWLGPEQQAQTTGDGQFLVFSTYARLLQGDTDTARDVYRYDAQTGMLDRVSHGEAGYDANGNNSAFDAKIVGGNRGGTVASGHEMNSRAISEDGSRIVFTTAEPLSPDAVNGLANAYIWHQEPGDSEGGVSLISSGNASEAVGQVVISPTGNDVFFATTQGLVPQDTDGATDIYDARVGGGFPPAPTERRPCSGDACQGPLTNPAPLLVPGSVPQAPGGNFAAPAKRAVKAKKVKPKRKRRKRGKASGRSGKANRAAGRSAR